MDVVPSDPSFGDGSLVYAAQMFGLNEDEVERAFTFGTVRKEKRARHQRKLRRLRRNLRLQREQERVSALENDWSVSSSTAPLPVFSPIPRASKVAREVEVERLYSDTFSSAPKIKKKKKKKRIMRGKQNKVTQPLLSYTSIAPERVASLRESLDSVTFGSGDGDAGIEGDLHIDALKDVVVRESLVKRMRELVRARSFDPSKKDQLVSLLSQCRRITVSAVKKIARWSACFVGHREFVWHGDGERPVNYLLRIPASLDFLDRIFDDVALLKNPLLLGSSARSNRRRRRRRDDIDIERGTLSVPA